VKALALAPTLTLALTLTLTLPLTLTLTLSLTLAWPCLSAGSGVRGTLRGVYLPPQWRTCCRRPRGSSR
jgi:hypothetical protein